MPKPLPVDWHEVKLLALAVGVREAARQLGIAETTVKRRCTREGWLAARHAAKASLGPAERKQAVADAHGVSLAVVSNVSAADKLATLGPDSRLKLAVALNKKARHIAEQEPAEISTTDVLQATKAGSTLHGWQEQAPGSAVMVNVNLLGLALEERSVVDLPDAAPQVPGPDAPG